MEETYSDFLQDAAARVQSDYAKRLLASIGRRNGGDNLFSGIAELLRGVFADVLTVPDFVGSA